MSPGRPRRRDAGSGSVVAVGTCAALLTLLLLALALAGAVLARHRAEAAADLAALAGADVVVGRAAGEPCARAATVLHAHGAVPAGCAVAADGTVTVTALVRPAGAAGLLGTARASARAGQATSGEATSGEATSGEATSGEAVEEGW